MSGSQAQLTKEVDSKLESLDYEKVQKLTQLDLIPISLNFNPLVNEVFQSINTRLNVSNKYMSDKEKALEFAIDKLKSIPPDVMLKILNEFEKEQQYIDEKLTFEVKQLLHGGGKEFLIDFGEGNISIYAMQKFGVGKYDGNNNIYKLTSDEIDLFFELKEDYQKRDLDSSPQGFDYHVDTFHAVAGVKKIMNATKEDGTKYTKEEAKQIVDDLRDIFGITKFGRYDADILINQHENTIIKRENGKLSYELKFDSEKKQTLYIGAKYEYNGASYKIYEKDSEQVNKVTKEIKDFQKYEKAQVWIYEEGKNSSVPNTIKNFGNKMRYFNKKNKYDIVISGHGDAYGVRMGAIDDAFDREIVEKNLDIFTGEVGSIDKIYLIACSKKTSFKNEAGEEIYFTDINFLANKLFQVTGANKVYLPSTITYGVEFDNKLKEFLFDYGHGEYGTLIYDRSDVENERTIRFIKVKGGFPPAYIKQINIAKEAGIDITSIGINIIQQKDDFDYEEGNQYYDPLYLKKKR